MLPGGALLDLHIHDTDFRPIPLWPARQRLSTGVTRAGNSIDHVVTQYNYPGGPAVYAEGGWLLYGNFNMTYTVLCERATLDFDLSRGADALVIYRARQRGASRQARWSGRLRRRTELHA